MKISALPPEEVLLSLYDRMVLIRKTEEKIAQLYPDQEIRCPTHLSIGQEAAASGVCVALKRDDYVVSTHRCHSHYLAKEGSLKSMFAELYGKVTGCSKGKGGSMHLVDPDQNMLGASAIVGGTIPIAVGIALAEKLRGGNGVAVAFFGDAATEQGVFHESLNFAALKKLPVLFVCENNFYATHTSLSDRQAVDNISERGSIYGVPGTRVNGSNVLEVYQAATEMVSRARRGEGPSIMEVQAYRWKEHVGPNYDFNLGYRTKKELDEWMERCPILQMEKILKDQSLVDEKEIQSIHRKIENNIEAAILLSKEDPVPEPTEIFTDIF